LAQLPGYLRISRTDDGDDRRWQVLVSEVDISRGERNWSICAVGVDVGSAAAGITTDSANSTSGNSVEQTANDNSFMMFPTTRFCIYHSFMTKSEIDDVLLPLDDSKPSDCSWLPADAEPKNCVDFFADIHNLRIVGRFADTGRRFILMTADSSEQFWSLRPSVAVIKQSGVVIRSW
jgi:hypothetical protein